MIEIKNVSKFYGEYGAVDDISLSIPKGSVFGLLGQNGAGKTTLMKMMVGLVRPDAGEILIGAKHVFHAATRENVGYMPEAPYFYDRLTGLEFLKFCGALFIKKYITSDAGYEDILRRVGIWEAKDRAIHTYSKGMKQRLGFAQVLVNNPSYIFLDEPLDGLDPVGRKQIKEVIQSLAKEGRTIFLNSHILYDTEELCDQIGILHAGKVIYAGTLKDFCRGENLEKQFISLIEAREKGKATVNI